MSKLSRLLGGKGKRKKPAPLVNPAAAASPFRPPRPSPEGVEAQRQAPQFRGHSDPFPPEIVAQRGSQEPGFLASSGNRPDYQQYEINNPDYAALLRRLFDLTGGSGFKLASEIVPVVSLSASEGVDQVRLFAVLKSPASGAGQLPFFGLVNPAGSGVTLVIERIRLHYLPGSDLRIVKMAGAIELVGVCGQTKASSDLFNWDSRVALKSYSELGVGCTAQMTGLGMLFFDNQGTVTAARAREPGFTILSGESLYIVHQGTALIPPITFEGYEVES